MGEANQSNCHQQSPASVTGSQSHGASVVVGATVAVVGGTLGGAVVGGIVLPGTGTAVVSVVIVVVGCGGPGIAVVPVGG